MQPVEENILQRVDYAVAPALTLRRPPLPFL